MPEQPLAVDSVTAASPEPPKPQFPVAPPLSPAARHWQFVLLSTLSLAYIVYVIWCVILLSFLPTTGPLKSLVPIGLGTLGVGALVFLSLGVVVLTHIAQSKVAPQNRKRALVKLLVFAIPGLLLSGATAYMITREPPLGIDIVSPASSQDLIAPVTMTFNLDTAVTTLRDRGFRPIQFKWDINSDRQIDQETVVPELTATFDRQGVYTVSAIMVGSDGSLRNASKRFIILQAVFSILPPSPLVDKPVIFSLSSLISDPAAIAKVQWDFDGDGKIDETTSSPQVTYTYYKTGTVKVSALVDLQNKTQARYERTVEIRDPPTLPFPVDLKSEPKHLIGSPPFPVLFTISSPEPLARVDWDFGDGDKGEGKRVLHTYNQNGTFTVGVKVRSQSGATAPLSSLVQVVDPLQVGDLTFEGKPEVKGDSIEGEAPLALNLKPKTSTPYVQFFWEAPDASDVGSTDDTLQAIYRREGNYTVTLIAQDLNNHVMRKKINVVVQTPTASIVINADPETGISPLTVKFDASASDIPNDDAIGYIWNFGDGSPEVTKGASISHQYVKPQTYTVNLRIQTSDGKEYAASKRLVVRAAALQACFLPSRTTVSTGQSIDFDPTCTTGEVASYLWDFDDASTTDEAHPVHLFTSPGVRTVKLLVEDAAGVRSTYSSTITVLP